MNTLMTIFDWIFIVSCVLTIILFSVWFMVVIISVVNEYMCHRDLERITPPNEELLKMVEENPAWLQEWLDEDMEGML